MSTLPYTITRAGSQIDIEVEYEVAPYYPGNAYGPPEHCDPPEGGEVEEITAYLDSKAFALSQSEIEQIEAHIYETHDYWG